MPSLKIGAKGANYYTPVKIAFNIKIVEIGLELRLRSVRKEDISSPTSLN